MSKAFTREDEGESAPLVSPRAPLPDGIPNYVTARGLAQLEAELAELDAELAAAQHLGEAAGRSARVGALAARRAELVRRIASAELVSPPRESTETIQFGATVTLSEGASLRRYTIVGVDEADAGQGRVAFVSPLARALLGRAAGETVRLRTPRGDKELEIVSVSYGE